MRQLCAACWTPYEPSADELSWVAVPAGREPPAHAYRAVGCAACGQSGYRGRVGVYELLELDETMAEAIEGPDERLREAAQARGMISTAAVAWSLWAAEVTSLDELRRVFG